MAQCFPKFREDDFAIELFSLDKKTISLHPEQPAAPPKIVHMRLAPGEGDRDFMPNLCLRGGPHLKASAPCTAAIIGLFPQKKKPMLQKTDGLRD